MSEIVKSLMELVKGRKTNSDLLYQWLACAAAMLTIAAYMRHQRPSDVLAEVTRVWGLDSASEWFTTGLPPVLALPNQTAQHIVVAIAEILVMAMLFLPFLVAHREERPVEWQAQGLLGARAPSTVWIVLMVASQLGSLDWIVAFSLSVASAVIHFLVAAAIIAALLYFAARLLHVQGLLSFVFKKLVCIAYDVIGLAFVVVASLGFAVIAPLIGKFFWTVSVESDSFFETKLRLAREKGERRRLARAKPSPAEEKY